MPAFLPGLQLNADFYAEVVGPILGDLPHAAARIGWGSDVLGLDTERSTDHGWGPHLEVFVDTTSVPAARVAVDAGLPEEFRGWPVRYGWDGTPVRHHVDVTALDRWLLDRLGVDATAALGTVDWLLMPQQRLLEVTAGAVYHDGPGDLTAVREVLAWYPEPVWLWMLAAQWRRIAQEESFVGRAAEVGDDLGSRLVVARLARELMRLWFLFHRSYWPYAKWFGSAFARLPRSTPLRDALERAMAADDHAVRVGALEHAYELVAAHHNDLGLTDAVAPRLQAFHSRPYRVLMAERYVDACLLRLADTDLRHFPLVGSLDQVADSSDVLTDGRLARQLGSLYRP